MNNEENDCPLSSKDWIFFLSNEITNLENEGYRNFNSIYPVIALFATAAAIIINSAFSTADNAGISPNDKSYIFYTIFKGMVTLNILFTIFLVVFIILLIDLIVKLKKANNLKKIRNNILEGSLKDTNEIRERYGGAMRNMSFRKKLDHIKKLIENINLNKEKKSELIGHLFLVGSILAVLVGWILTTSSQLLILYGSWWISSFTVFVFASIVYYISIQKDTSKPIIKWLINLITLFIAFPFSALVSLNLFIVSGNELVYLSYLFVLGFLLYLALIEP